MTHKRRAMVFLSLIMWGLSLTGFLVARELWWAYGLDWKEFLKMPIGQAFVLGIYLLGAVVFSVLGTVGILWATEEKEE